MLFWTSFRSGRCGGIWRVSRRPWAISDPYGLDLQLALYVCYELHYRGFAGVDPRWEWDPSLLHLRGLLEESFLSVVQRDVGEIAGDERAADVMEAPHNTGRPPVTATRAPEM